MASTTEELSSQAEQLKATIAFFSLDTGRQRRVSAPPAHRQVKQIAIGHLAAKPAVAAKAPARGGQAARGGKASGGIALDLGGTGGADHLDEEFEKF